MTDPRKDGQIDALVYYFMKVHLHECPICRSLYSSLEEHVKDKGDPVHLIFEVMNS